MLDIIQTNVVTSICSGLRNADRSKFYEILVLKEENLPSQKRETTVASRTELLFALFVRFKTDPQHAFSKALTADYGEMGKATCTGLHVANCLLKKNSCSRPRAKIHLDHSLVFADEQCIERTFHNRVARRD